MGEGSFTGAVRAAKTDGTYLLVDKRRGERNNTLCTVCTVYCVLCAELI